MSATRPRATKAAAHYHHGNLRQALLDSALTVLAEQGVAGFSLRETARRAGVTAAAPKHHFADSRALLTTLATRAFTELADALEQADASGRAQADRIEAQGVAYVSFALRRRALFDLMWRADLLDLSDEALLAQKTRAFALLDARVRGPRAATLAHTDAKMAPTFACWSLVHGFAHLAHEGAFGPERDAAETAAACLLRPALRLLLKPNFKR